MYVKSISRKHRQAINKFKNKVAFDLLQVTKKDNFNRKKKKNEQKH